MADSYVCSGATMKCTMGDQSAKLTVLPSRTVFLCGKPMANISDHASMVNLAPFGKCRSLAYPATAAATAAALGTLTPMPCVHNTPINWMPGKPDYLIQGQPALLKSCKCTCIWGGIISITDDGQKGEGTQYVTNQARTDHKTSNEQQTKKKKGSINLINDLGLGAFVPEQTNTNIVSNNPFIKDENYDITVKEAEFLLPRFSYYNENAQKIILDIANNKLLNNDWPRNVRMATAESHMLFNNYNGAPGKVTSTQAAAIANNNVELEKALGIKKGDPMTAAKADKNNSNPKYRVSQKYQINCVTTTATYILRLRGFDVSANPRTNKADDHINIVATQPTNLWKNADGTDVVPTKTSDWMAGKKYDKMNSDRYLEFWEEVTKEPGVYQLAINWKESGAHSLILQRFKNGELRYIDPQSGKSSASKNDFKEYLTNSGSEDPNKYNFVLRLDDKVFNTEYADIFNIKK